MEKHIKLKKVKRARKHGFLTRMASHSGKKVIKSRRDKNRQSLTI
jgi:ribosomal protein L34